MFKEQNEDGELTSLESVNEPRKAEKLTGG